MKDGPDALHGQSILGGNDAYGGVESYEWEEQDQVVAMTSSEHERFHPSQPAFSPFASSDSASFDSPEFQSQTMFDLHPSQLASTSYRPLSHSIAQSAPPHLQSFPHHQLSSNAFGWPEASSTAIDPSLVYRSQPVGESSLVYPPYDDTPSRNPLPYTPLHTYYPPSISVSSTPTLLSIDPSDLLLPTPPFQPSPNPIAYSMSGEELGRNEGSETGSASGDEDSAAGAEAGQRTQDVATEEEGRRLKKQEPKPRTKSGNKPRTILKHAEKLALIAMSGADKTLTQEQIAAKFE
jgi:hypothetical protein